MRRRELLMLCAGALAVPSGLFARPARKVYRIGFLGTAFASGYENEVEWIRTGLRQYGYVEDKNLIVEYRWGEGKRERDKTHAAEFVALKVDAIVVHGLPGALVAAHETSTIPIVMADGSDPVEAGLAATLARPGRNVTGSTSFVPEESAKRLELLQQVVPHMRRIAFLISSEPPPALPITRQALANAAASMKVELREFRMHDATDLPQAFTAMSEAHIDAAVINNEPLLNSHAAAIAVLAGVKKLPAIGYARFADAGGLLAYGANRPALYGRVGYFLDRIFKGDKPGDLPFERAKRFDLIINLNAAQALGVQIPESLLLRADRVIE